MNMMTGGSLSQMSMGTFSKILAPGYRLGWVCAEDEILAKYNFMEQAASLQASTIGQMETSKWIDMFDQMCIRDRCWSVYSRSSPTS